MATTENRSMSPGDWINNMIGAGDAYNPSIDGADPNSLAVKIGSAYRASPYWTGQGQFFGDPTAFAQNYTGTSDPLSAFQKLQGMGDLPGISTNFGVLNPQTGMLDQQNLTGDGLGEWLGPMGVMAGAAGIGGLMGGAFSGLGGAASSGTGAFDMGGMGANFGNYVSPAVGAATGTGATGMNDWWSELGLTAQDVGIDPGVFTTDPSMSDLTGGVLNDAGSVAGGLPSIPNGAGSLISKLMQGGISGSDLTNLLGKLGAAGLQAYSSNNQANQLGQLAQQYQAFGAPSRARYEASMTPGFDPNSIPGYAGALDSTSKSVLARLSATGGNPFGNPAGLVQANKDIVSGTALPAIQNYQATNANTGFGQAMNGAMQLQQQQIGAQSNVPAALASGLGSVTAPDNSLTSLLAQLKGSGLTLNNGF